MGGGPEPGLGIGKLDQTCVLYLIGSISSISVKCIIITVLIYAYVIDFKRARLDFLNNMHFLLFRFTARYGWFAEGILTFLSSAVIFPISEIIKT